MSGDTVKASTGQSDPRRQLVELFDSYVPAWMERALCAQIDHEMFFPEKGGSTKEAKKVCGMCPVQAQCLEYALDLGVRDGIYGGKSERERRALLRERKEKAS